jgi:membrane-bound serine protease (ClpP class)
MVLMARFLPKTRLYGAMVPHTVSGVKTGQEVEAHEAGLLGREGVTISLLRPGGKARFDDEILDVISDGELVEAGRRVRVIGASGASLLVRVV